MRTVMHTVSKARSILTKHTKCHVTVNHTIKQQAKQMK
jgi:hypothetical protein